MQNNSRFGITLIEVLIVFAIIVLLILFTSRALQMAREASRKAQCMNNIRQIAGRISPGENDRTAAGGGDWEVILSRKPR